MADEVFQKYSRFLYRHHPWHGMDIGKNAPTVVNAYVEITPSDMVKYEVDKATFERYKADPALAHEFVGQAKRREVDHLLLYKPGPDRGVAD